MQTLLPLQCKISNPHFQVFYFIIHQKHKLFTYLRNWQKIVKWHLITKIWFINMCILYNSYNNTCLCVFKYQCIRRPQESGPSNRYLVVVVVCEWWWGWLGAMLGQVVVQVLGGSAGGCFCPCPRYKFVVSNLQYILQ